MAPVGAALAQSSTVPSSTGDAAVCTCGGRADRTTVRRLGDDVGRGGALGGRRGALALGRDAASALGAAAVEGRFRGGLADVVAPRTRCSGPRAAMRRSLAISRARRASRLDAGRAAPGGPTAL